MEKSELLKALDAHDAMLVACADGTLAFREFIDRYDNFYASWALNGHESDADDKALLADHSVRIYVHRRVWEEVILRLTDEKYAGSDDAIEQGFFGEEEGLKIVRNIVRESRVFDGAATV